MNNLENIENEKDELFYSDLIYEIKKLANLDVEDDEITNERIEKRQEMTETIIDGHRVYPLTEFQIALFEFVTNIGDVAGVIIGTPEGIAKYPELVEESLKELQDPKETGISKRLGMKKKHN